MRLIVETDIGHDPDDFFAITYLIAASVQIDAILVTPGDPDQLAIAQLIRRKCSAGTLVASKPSDSHEPRKLSSGSIHHELLKRYHCSLTGPFDAWGDEAIALTKEPETELFVIGPASSVGMHLRKGGSPFARATMQGGFVPYPLYRPSVILDKFEGASYMPTFNLNDDRKGAEAFLAAPMPRQMVGKNVCHTVVFDKERFATFQPPKNRAAELFHEAANLYFAKHDSKKFHDPIAAVCHLHPEVGTWIKGKTVKERDGWTTTPNGADDILVDIDREKAWHYLSTMT